MGTRLLSAKHKRYTKLQWPRIFFWRCGSSVGILLSFSNYPAQMFLRCFLRSDIYLPSQNAPDFAVRFCVPANRELCLFLRRCIAFWSRLLCRAGASRILRVFGTSAVGG